MYDTILLPTDGSDAAAAAASTAITLAERFGATIHVVYVVELDDVPDDARDGAAERLTRHGKATVSSVAEEAAKAHVDVFSAVVDATERTHQEIVDCALRRDVDLIVMGTSGRTGVHQLVLGSVTERTLRISPVPVLTVHEGEPLDPETASILVPTDGSATANAAADHAITLAAMTEATLHVVHAVDPTPVSGEFDVGVIVEALEATGQHALDDVVERASELAIPSVQSSILAGRPARAILDYADEQDVDLIVMGTHGRTGLDRYLLGSVTEKVVRLASMPVLTISTFDQ